MADEFSNKLPIDEDVLAISSDEHAGFDDGVLLGDLLNEIRSPETAVSPPAVEAESKTGFHIPAIIFALIAAGVLYTVISPWNTHRKPAETVAVSEPAAATVSHQDKPVAIEPVIKLHKSTTGEQNYPASDVHKPASYASAQTKQEFSTVTVNSNLDPQHDSVGPPWALNLLSLAHSSEATDALSTLQAAGFSAELLEVTVHGKQWYRIRIPGFATVREANARAAEIAKKTTYLDAWVGGQ